MDLERLRIRDAAPAARSPAAAVAVTAVACLLLGLLAGRWLAPGERDKGLPVETLIVRPTSGELSAQFTAGGWIEVAAPDYPVVVAARVPEVLDKLLVKEGDVVQPGALLGELYSANVSNRLAEARAREQLADAELRQMEAGYRQEDVAAAAAKLVEAREAERLARATVERNGRLPEGALSGEQLDQDAAAERMAAARREQAAAEAERLRAGYRREEVDAARARRAQAAAARRQAELDLSFCALRAPALGKPLRVLRTLRRVGDWVDPKDAAAVVSLYDPTNVQVRVDVTQSRIKGVRAGSAVLVSTEADPERRYKGTVLRLEPQADLAKNTITVRARLDEPDLLLFPEMVAQIAFVRGEGAGEARRIRVPEAAVRRAGERASVYVFDRGAARQRAVTLGEVKEGWAEVTDGLQSGQRVIVSPLEALADGQRVSLGR